MRETIEGAFVETEEAPNTDDADKTKNEEEQSETNGAAAVGQAGGNADGVYPVINSKAKVNQLGNIASTAIKPMNSILIWINRRKPMPRRSTKQPRRWREKRRYMTF